MGRGALHGVLENPADVQRPFMLFQEGDVLPVQGNAALVQQEGAADGVEQGGFPRAVGADDGQEFPGGHMQAHMVQGGMLDGRAFFKNLYRVLNIKHGLSLPASAVLPSCSA